jgi:hypothetical protein
MKETEEVSKSEVNQVQRRERERASLPPLRLLTHRGCAFRQVFLAPSIHSEHIPSRGLAFA